MTERAQSLARMCSDRKSIIHVRLGEARIKSNRLSIASIEGVIYGH